MKLRGILDLSLGNFLCLRGFAPLGVLFDISEADPCFQRDLLTEHRDEMVAFLSQGEYLFFPEVILCSTLAQDSPESDQVTKLRQNVLLGKPFTNLEFDDYRISNTVRRAKKAEESRAFSFFQTATLNFKKSPQNKFSRIDGNHRLSAVPENEKFRSHNTPFCLILFRNKDEAARFSRVLFHNINFKQVPLTKEQNLKLILDEPGLFPDEKLKTDPFFGLPYYLARQLYNHLDFDLLKNLKQFIEKTPRTFLVEDLTFLLQKKALQENENSIKQFKEALGRVNAVFDRWPALKDSENRGLLAAFLYYDLRPTVRVDSFVHWVLENHLHLIEQSSAEDLIQIFDKVLESKRRTVFVSMPIGKAIADNHFKIIKRICEEVSQTYNLKPELKVQRVDWFQDGTSYVITDKIIQMICDCGLLIGNLTYGNLSVYHEIGFVMGRAKVEGKDAANILLFLDESVPDEKDKSVGFNLQGIKQLRFTETEKFADDLRKNIELFFNLKAN